VNGVELGSCCREFKFGTLDELLISAIKEPGDLATDEDAGTFSECGGTSFEIGSGDEDGCCPIFRCERAAVWPVEGGDLESAFAEGSHAFIEGEANWLSRHS